MCGLLGWVGIQTSQYKQNFEQALDEISYRGPDGHGMYSDANALIGHRRLAILDHTEVSRQPMVDGDSGAVLVFNGEIYNYPELAENLRAEGCFISGRSDTEVLFKALLAWGPSALNKLNGMFAFALWSPKSQRLLLARDRFGVKPLYYRITPHGIQFASEPKALLALPPTIRRVNREKLLNFLSGHPDGKSGETFYDGVFEFPNASYSYYNFPAGEISFSRYWDYPDRKIRTDSPEDIYEEFSGLLVNAVQRRFRSDVPVGIMVSGGLDSTAILSSAAVTQTAPLICYTSSFVGESASEARWAAAACGAVGVRPQEVFVNSGDWLHTLSHIVWHMDSPNSSPAVFPLWNLMNFARSQGSLVLLEGQGADEALAGYVQYAALSILRHVAEGELGSALSSYLGLRRSFGGIGIIGWMLREQFPKLLCVYRRSCGLNSVLREGHKSREFLRVSPYETRLLADRLKSDHSSVILPKLLHYGDAISMAHGVELRQPFLDVSLVDFMFSLGESSLFKNGESKWLLREFLRRNQQRLIAERYYKQGYWSPLRKWLMENRYHCEEILLKKDNLLLEWCDPVKVRHLFDRCVKGGFGTEAIIYKLLTSSLWLDSCVDN